MAAHPSPVPVPAGHYLSSGVLTDPGRPHHVTAGSSLGEVHLQPGLPGPRPNPRLASTSFWRALVFAPAAAAAGQREEPPPPRPVARNRPQWNPAPRPTSDESVVVDAQLGRGSAGLMWELRSAIRSPRTDIAWDARPRRPPELLREGSADSYWRSS